MGRPAGDVMLWDNRRVMHKTTTRELPAAMRHAICRITAMGGRPPWQLPCS
nr:TauD/TfdA family dioxygenase [Cupriavidus basilensis]